MITSIKSSKITVVISTTVIIALLLFIDTPVLAILLKIHNISYKYCYTYNILTKSAH